MKLFAESGHSASVTPNEARPARTVLAFPTPIERATKALGEFPVRGAAALMLLDVKDFAVISTRSERLTNTQMDASAAVMGATILWNACESLNVDVHVMMDAVAGLPTFSEVLSAAVKVATAKANGSVPPAA